MNGRPGVWGEGAAERPILRDPAWEEGGEILRRCPPSTQDRLSFVSCEWRLARVGPTLVAYVYGVVLLMHLVVRCCPHRGGHPSNAASPTAAPPRQRRRTTRTHPCPSWLCPPAPVSLRLTPHLALPAVSYLAVAGIAFGINRMYITQEKKHTPGSSLLIRKKQHIHRYLMHRHMT